MGVNAGDGLGFHPLPFSGEAEALANLPSIGRFFHHVTNDVITQEACINEIYSGNLAAALLLSLLSIGF